MRSISDTLSTSFTGIRSASSWFELYAAFSTMMMLLRTVVNDLIPHQARTFIVTKLKAFFSDRHNINQVSLQIDNYWDGQSNQLFKAAKEYLPTKITGTYKSLKVGKLSKDKNLVVGVDGKQDVTDEFEGIKLKWKLVTGGSPKEDGHGGRYGRPKEEEENAFTLTFDEKHREKVMNDYIPHVLSTYTAMKAEQRALKIHSMSGRSWKQSDLTHPATFDTIALDPDLKKSITDDLDRFLKRKELYKRVGKPWKRGYLLYGPPGTGKSSLIAAIANYLKFDVYDLELTSVYSNTDLMRAMRDTSNQSIIVIEDIDCNKEVLTRSTASKFDDGSDSDSEMEPPPIKVLPAVKSFTLSGLLNYMDGLWTSCGEERIIIFTTNHKDKIDPALLRPGRMDMHINLSYLRAKAFRTLASNYLGIEGEHSLFEVIEELLEKVEVTPAVVAEHLLRSDDPDVTLEGLVNFLKEKDMDGLISDS